MFKVNHFRLQRDILHQRALGPEYKTDTDDAQRQSFLLALNISQTCFQARSQGIGNGVISPPNAESLTKIFRLIKLLMCKSNAYFSANQRNCFRKLSYFSFQSNHIKAYGRVYQFSMINKTLYIG